MADDNSDLAAQEWLNTLLQHLGVEATAIANTPEACATKLKNFGGTWFELQVDHLSPDSLAILVGRNGENLDAMQYLLNAAVHVHQQDSQQTYTVEVQGRRLARYTEVLDLAESAAAQVRQTGAEFEMPPLSAAERRLVHTLLVDEADVETYSRGQEPDRRLVVKLAEQEPV
jgi:spoIIIJ-associated protein